MVNINIKPGEYKIIRVDGTVTLHESKPIMQRLHRELGCDLVDTVILDREREIVMVVDDSGMVDGKPLNLKATELYQAICKPGTVHGIHGDVAIVNDRDFA